MKVYDFGVAEKWKNKTYVIVFENINFEILSFSNNMTNSLRFRNLDFLDIFFFFDLKSNELSIKSTIYTSVIFCIVFCVF